MSKKAVAKPEKIRCGIYTRKSSEEGLDQEFNSLDAQRESAEAFIASQKAQGWVCLPTQYNDGGFSGGSLARPGMDRLMADIEAGEIDCVVVYKVDRLSRSLMDFSRIMEAFDRQGVSFVSVTQQFNTASSMGRLTLNILLSFAQFEREIIGERIRDKVAAQKKRGKWAGGVPVLGYDVERSGPSPRLTVNAAEAGRVRAIFEMYLQKQSLLPVVQELADRGWTNKKRVTAKGRAIGGKPLDKSTLHAHLTNPIYTGKVSHKGELYQGEHEAIIEQDVFDRVQKLLKHHGRGGGAEVRNKYGALLRGILRCKGCDQSMTHTFTTARGKRQTQYRYYRCVGAIKRGAGTCASGTLPAAEIERVVVEEVRGILTDPGLLGQVVEESRSAVAHEIRACERDLDDLKRGLRRRHRALRKLVGEPGEHTDRVAELNDAIAADERAVRETESRLTELRARSIDPDDARAALDDFDGLWESLIPREQARLLRLLIEHVEYDNAAQTVSVTFRPGWINALTKKQTKEAA